MNKKYRALVSNTLIFALGSVGSKLITFFLVPLYTNVLTKEEYGTADLVITWSNVLIPVMSVVIQDAVFRFSLSKENEKGVVIKNSFFILALGSVLTCCLYPLIGLYPAVSEWSIYLIAITIFHMFSNVMYAYAKSIGKTKLYAVVSVLNTLVLAVSNVLFLLVFDWGVKGYLLANVLGLAVAVFVLLIFTHALNDCLSSKFDRRLLRQMLVFSAPLVVNNLSWWILNSFGRVFIEVFHSAAELGMYTAASKVPALLSIITTIFMQAWNISASKDYDEDRDKAFCSNVFNAFQFLMFVGGSFVVMVAKPFMKMYVGQEFFESWRYVPLLILGIIYYSFSSFFGAIYGAVKKNRNVALTTIYAAIINILITLLLIESLCIWAAAIANAVSYFVIGIYRMIDSRRFYRFDIDFGEFWLCSLILLAQVVFVSLDVWIYLVSAVAICLLLLINRKNVSSVISFGKDYFKRRR